MEEIRTRKELLIPRLKLLWVKEVFRRLDALGMLITCRRCQGTGIYERNAFDSRCYGCMGAKKKLPPLTARLAKMVRDKQDLGLLNQYLSELREKRGAAQARREQEQAALVPEIVKYANRE